MFWRRKSDGFDWHKHVRTTIKLRREARKQRLDDAVELALGGLKEAGKAGVSAGSSGVDKLNQAISTPITLFGQGLAATLATLTSLLSRPMEPIGRFIERRELAPVLGFIAVLVGLLGLGRLRVE